jgi:hypothetical protein
VDTAPVLVETTWHVVDRYRAGTQVSAAIPQVSLALGLNGRL